VPPQKQLPEAQLSTAAARSFITAKSPPIHATATPVRPTARRESTASHFVLFSPSGSFFFSPYEPTTTSIAEDQAQHQKPSKSNFSEAQNQKLFSKNKKPTKSPSLKPERNENSSFSL
jgi:hypothetical protein